MEYPFDELHAGIKSQIMNLPAGIPDSEAVTQAKALPDSIEKFLALGKAFSRQLRYREAIDAYRGDGKCRDKNGKQKRRKNLPAVSASYDPSCVCSIVQF